MKTLGKGNETFNLIFMFIKTDNMPEPVPTSL